MESINAPLAEIEGLGAGSLRRAAILGDTKTGSIMVGQIAGLVNDIKPVREIITSIIKEAAVVQQRISEVKV
ncbi:MAG: hypothetical protein E7E28_03420 [Negativicoccus succinicivorans]|nr:hypothetical protein [Negativicoccus succinicivorans]